MCVCPEHTFEMEAWRSEGRRGGREAERQAGKGDRQAGMFRTPSVARERWGGGCSNALNPKVAINSWGVTVQNMSLS